MKWNPNEILTEFVDFDSEKHKSLKVEEKKLSIIPDGRGIGWFSDSKGTYLYKELTGNFMIETEVEVRRLDHKPYNPEAQFSSGGLLVRKPSSKNSHETWLMYNIGYQNSFYGREIKATRPSQGFRLDPTYLMGYKSLSTLYLMPAADEKAVKLRMARINEEFRCYYHSNGQWHEEIPTKDMAVMGNGTQYPVENFNEETFRPNQLNFGDNVQVGIIANPGMNTKNPFVKFRDAYMSFSYVMIEKIDKFEECLQMR